MTMEIGVSWEKASVRIYAQIKQYGNFVKNGGTVSQL